MTERPDLVYRGLLESVTKCLSYNFLGLLVYPPGGRGFGVFRRALQNRFWRSRTFFVARDLCCGLVGSELAKGALLLLLLSCNDHIGHAHLHVAAAFMGGALVLLAVTLPSAEALERAASVWGAWLRELQLRVCALENTGPGAASCLCTVSAGGSVLAEAAIFQPANGVSTCRWLLPRIYSMANCKPQATFKSVVSCTSHKELGALPASTPRLPRTSYLPKSDAVSAPEYNRVLVVIAASYASRLPGAEAKSEVDFRLA